MLSIGEFSIITQLSIKALRLYHAEGLLLPEKIDKDSGYRFYDPRSIAKAHSIRILRNMDFTLKEIKDILSECTDSTDLYPYLEKKIKEINKTISRYKSIKKALELHMKSPDPKILVSSQQIREETIPDLLAASIRFKGPYPEIGKRITQLYHSVGRYCIGRSFSLYYEQEYKEDNADIEVCIEIRKPVKMSGINCRKISGGKAVTLIHQGPYETVGRSYQKFFEYLQENRITLLPPSREIYIKGPSLIFKTNPKHYLTKIIGLYNSSF